MIDWEAIRKQEPDAGSVFSHVKRMFQLRARQKELAIGHIEEVSTDHPQDVFAAIRTSEDLERSALVVFNFSESYRDVIVDLGGCDLTSLRNYLSGERMAPVNGSVSLHLHPYGFKFLRLETEPGHNRDRRPGRQHGPPDARSRRPGSVPDAAAAGRARRRGGA